MKDETLILYFYNDGLSASERRKITTALAEDAELAARYETLCRELETLSDAPEVPMPEGLEYRLKSALQRASRLERADGSNQAATRSAPLLRWPIAWGAGIVAALAVGVSIGLWMGGQRPESDAPGPQVVSLPPAASPEWSPVAFQHGLASHFRSGRSDIAELRGQPARDRAALVNALVQQNRLYARLAMQNDAPELARVLRSFEPILMKLAREDLSTQEADNLRSQLEFEFTVMLTKLARDSSQQTESPTQEIRL